MAPAVRCVLGHTAAPPFSDSHTLRGTHTAHCAAAVCGYACICAHKPAKLFAHTGPTDATTLPRSHCVHYSGRPRPGGKAFSDGPFVTLMARVTFLLYSFRACPVRASSRRICA